MNFDTFLYHFQILLVESLVKRSKEINGTTGKPHLTPFFILIMFGYQNFIGRLSKTFFITHMQKNTLRFLPEMY